MEEGNTMKILKQNRDALGGRADRAAQCSAPSRQMLVQPKLELTTPGDSYEREADRMADYVMRKPFGVSFISMPSTVVANQPKILRRATGSSSGIAVGNATESGIHASRGSGQPLPTALRSRMESGFGTDFSGVRLHTGSASETMSSDLNAKAFTYGNDIYFNRGQYSPDTTAGQHLIAHELTHVVQQSGKVGRESTHNGTGELDNLLWKSYPQQLNEKEIEVKNALISYSQQGKEPKDKNLKKFCKKYNGEIKKIIDKDQEEQTNNIGNIARVYRLYGHKFFIRKKRNLKDYVNTCGVKMSIAFGKAGLAFPKNSGYDFLGKIDGVKLKIDVLSGPRKFKNKLDQLYGYNNPNVIKISKEELNSIEHQNKDKREFILGKIENDLYIYIMFTSQFSDAGGHITLVKDKNVKDNLYIEKAEEIYFYKYDQKVFNQLESNFNNRYNKK